MSSRKYTIPVLALLFTLVGIGAYVAPVYACNCNQITFTPSSAETYATPYTLSTIPQNIGPTGNTITYDTGATYMYVYITGVIPAGWTVSITTGSTHTTISPTQMLVTEDSSGTFSYTITVTAPATSNTRGQFTINAYPTNSAVSPWPIYGGAAACTPVTVYLKTGSIPPFYPPTGVPMFPLGMALLMALAFPALLLVKRKFAGTPKL